MTTRKRDKGGKFVTHVPGPENINIISRELVDPILELAEKDVSPTAADLDRHQANVEAENQARMDTERKQAESAAGAQWNPPPGYSLKEVQTVGCGHPIRAAEDVPEYEMHPLQSGNVSVGETLGPVKPTPYGGIAMFSASLAILAMLGTLWAVYYVLRPKLDNFKISVTVPSNFHSGDVATCVPGSQAWSPVGVPNPKGNIQSEHPGIGGVGGVESVPNSQFLVTAKEDVWLKFSMDGKSVMPGRQFVKGEQIGWNLTDNDILEIRAGKPDSLVIYFSNREIHPENKYHGGGNLAEYVLDGKELLAGK